MSRSLKILISTWLGFLLLIAARYAINKAYIVSAGIGYFIVAVAFIMVIMAGYAMVLAVKELRRGERKLGSCVAIALSIPTIIYCLSTIAFFLFFLGVAG